MATGQVLPQTEKRRHFQATAPAPPLSCRPQTFRIQNQQRFPQRAPLSSLSRRYGGVHVSPRTARVSGESGLCSGSAEAAGLELWARSAARPARFPSSARQVLCSSTDQIPSALGYLAPLFLGRRKTRVIWWNNLGVHSRATPTPEGNSPSDVSVVPPHAATSHGGCRGAEGEHQISRGNALCRQPHGLCPELAFRAETHCTPGERSSGQDLPTVFVMTGSYFFSLLKINPRPSPPETAAPPASLAGEREGSACPAYPEPPLPPALPAPSPVVRGTSARKSSAAKLTLPGNDIGIDHGTAQFPQYGHHRALPRRDSTRESNQEHRALKRKEKSSTTRPDRAGLFTLCTANIYPTQATPFKAHFHTFSGHHREFMTMPAPL